jgi:molybdopterin converting factor small subunit
MKVNVKLYGALKKYAPGDQSEFLVTLASESTVKDVHLLLRIPEGGHATLINGRRSDPDAELKNGDTMVILPPISGG